MKNAILKDGNKITRAVILDQDYETGIHFRDGKVFLHNGDKMKDLKVFNVQKPQREK